MNLPAFPSNALLRRIARYPLRFLPRDLVVPVLQGPLRGTKWIVGSSNHGCWLGSYEYEKQRRIASELRPGSVFYDIGASAGFYSLLAARRVAPGKVYAFDPLPRNIRYLEKHLDLNHIENVKVPELAISDRVGITTFQEEATPLMGHLAEQGTRSVRTANLDALLDDQRISPPNFIKMDIEGAELLSLRGAGYTFQRYRPLLFLPTHSREVHRECWRLLESWGYECQLLGGATSKDSSEFVAAPM